MEDIVLLLPYPPAKESEVAPGISRAIAVDALAGSQWIGAKGKVFKNYKRRHACGRYNSVPTEKGTSAYFKTGITSLGEGIKEFGPFRDVNRLGSGVIHDPETANVNQSSVGGRGLTGSLRR